MDSEPENASEGYQSAANTILQPEGTPSTCFMLVFIFLAYAGSSENGGDSSAVMKITVVDPSYKTFFMPELC
jgi:hypothetical protein